MLTADFDAMLTGAQAARAVGVSKQLVNNWRARGLLKQTDGRYRYGDVVDVERRTRRSTRSSRRTARTAAAV